MKFAYMEKKRSIVCGRPPHGGRGLKLLARPKGLEPPTSPPARGAWIEIPRL